MFQTESIIALQGLFDGALDGFMLFISGLGYSSFYIPALMAVAFGINFRRGFLLIQLMLWVGMLTDALKDFFALPRPADVDSAVRLVKYGVPNPTPFAGQGGADFWSLPAAEAVQAVRAEVDPSFGLPSGHVSGAVTFWAGLAWLFRRRLTLAAAVAMCALMPLSRMYLGRHFLGDVLGGLLLGALILAAAHALFGRPAVRGRLLSLVRLRPAAEPGFLLALVALLVAPFALFALGPAIEADDVGQMFGLNAAFLVIALGGLPADAAPWPKRIVRVLLAFGLFTALSWLAERALDGFRLDDDVFAVGFTTDAVVAFLAFWGGLKLARRLKLFVGTAAP